ncbi:MULTISPECIES: hypothetical protein [unclassified Microcoleus]|uniref:hypothetical protein n=1 Tax=unclassified Microcoleus TaxID=2642155 RepID=UPI002FD3D1FC
MAVIVSGTDETFTGTKLEDKLWQAIHHIQNGEKLITDSTERFNVSKDDTFNLTGDFTLPGALVWNESTATFKEEATPYLSSLAFTPGSPSGTFKATTLSQYFIDLIKYCIMKQNLQATTPAGLKNVTLEFDYNLLLFSGTFKLPYTVELSADGAIIERAVEWIVT